MNFLHELNLEQQLAVGHINGPLLVLAGAGSGKTRVVAYRIAYLIQKDVHPSQILAVTFTNKAAKEMQERVHLLLQNHMLEEQPTICTFHSLGVRILRESIHHLGYSNHFIIYDTEDSNKLLKGVLQAANIKKEVEFKTFRNFISYAKNELQGPEEVDLSGCPDGFQHTFPEVYKKYQERLKETNALDFDDLLFLTVQLFQKYPDILSSYQKRWPYLLIDEYQDTNRVQYLMARLIVGEKRNIFVVGDPDQSIYSWRGANVQNILNFEKDYPGAKVVRLEQNYRSRKNILDAANKLIINNSSRFEKNLWSTRGEGEKISLFVGSTEREEAGFVLHEIERLHTFHKIPYSEMTIFYRTNFQSRIFEDFLLRKRIPYVIVGGISFYQRKEIKDVLAYLRMIISDHDFVAFERTINLPKRGIGPTTLEKIRAHATQLGTPIVLFCLELIDGEKTDNLRFGLSSSDAEDFSQQNLGFIGEVDNQGPSKSQKSTRDARKNPEAEGVKPKSQINLKLSTKQREGLFSYFETIKNLRALQKTLSLEKLVIETVRQSQYLEVLREEKETFDDRKANVDELVSKAHEWEMLNDSVSLESFLEELSLKSSLDEALQEQDKVNLMTLHNGKGLEFDTAFLVGMEEDLFPHVNSRDSQHALEEERRLCYVGMTRAKERLYLTAAETRFIWGSTRMMRPSRFLREIPRDYLHRHR